MTNPLPSRLTYTRAAYLRRIVMSYDTSVFLVVEGKDSDRYFVDRICRSSAQIKRAGYEVRLISQIGQVGNVYSGGKAAVLSLYDYCRRAGKLAQTNSKGRRSICFFVDRDTQNITGGKRRSPHVIYTTLADVEAHIFSDADEREALAAAASLEAASAQMLMSGLGDWRRDLADVWRQWIEECYVAEAVRARCWVGFGQASSRIHVGPDGLMLDASRLVQAQAAVKASSPMSAAAFVAKRSAVLGRIDRLYRLGEQVTLVKGKWFPKFLTIMVERYFAGIGFSDGWNATDFQASLTRCYISHIDTTSTRIVAIRDRFEALLSM